MRSEPPAFAVFGALPEGVRARERRAAYAVVRGDDGRVAAVGAMAGDRMRYWLPGGGMHDGETAEATVVRETREELARGIEPGARIGEALQYFRAGDEGWYAMTAIFVSARFVGEAEGEGEHPIRWLDPERERDHFFHACHAWAALKTAGKEP